MNVRNAFAYVVAIEGPTILLNLRDAHRGQVAAHPDGASLVTEVGGLFAIGDGARLQVLRVQSLSFAEPKEAHRAGVGSTASGDEPLRHVKAGVLGILVREDGALSYTPNSLVSPALGADAYPLSDDELACVLSVNASGKPEAIVGREVRTGRALICSLSNLLGRHVAVLGSTGQGKSCFTAAMLQQLVRSLEKPRIVIFDVNGEYATALADHVRSGEVIETMLGGPEGGSRIPYYAFGRNGLTRFFSPSEKTQRPALVFALDNLKYVAWDNELRGASLGDKRGDYALKEADLETCLFHDLRPELAGKAHAAIENLRRGKAFVCPEWPPMEALACLVADSHSLKRNGNQFQRDGFLYSNIAPLVTKILRYADDRFFKAVVDIDGGPPCSFEKLDWEHEATALCNQYFGLDGPSWKVHIVNLRYVAHDLLPHILGALLELLAGELFKRGQANTYPTLLVLEEAHHYLRSVSDTREEEERTTLAYERLAKEGRKFNLSLWLSTQRPSEISPTVLAQCGSWVVFRLNSERDLNAVRSATEWAGRYELSQVAGLPRQEAFILGAATTMPLRIVAPRAEPPPRSEDPDFSRWQG